MDQVGVAVVGCGFVGTGAHLPALKKISEAKLVAVVDMDPKRLKKTAEKFKVENAYADVSELVKNKAVDAVIVSVPTPFHSKVAIEAANAGKHVLCEMPLASTLKEVDEMTAAAKKSNVILYPGLNFRFTPNYVKAKELVDQGDLGSPTAVMYREFIPVRDLANQWPPGSWAWDIKKSGGPLFTLCVWSLDLVRWVAGSEISQMKSAAKHFQVKGLPAGILGYDAFLCLQFANGVVGSMQYSGAVNPTTTASILEVIGDNMKVLSASGNNELSLYGENPDRTEWFFREGGAKVWGHQQQDEHFFKCIREGKQPLVSPEDGRRAVELALDILRTAQ